MSLDELESASFSRDGETRFQFDDELTKVAQIYDQHTRGQLSSNKRVLILLKSVASDLVMLKNTVANQNDTVLRLRRELDELKTR